jgi:hypothetical protein
LEALLSVSTPKEIEEMKYVPLEELKNYIPPMETNQEKLLKITLTALDTDVTPKDETPDGVACAEVVSTLIKKILPDFPITPSTKNLDMKLYSDKRFVKITTPEMGSVVVSPRKGTVYGHCGIFITSEKIASNNSFGVNKGKLTGNYSFQEWIEEFKDRRNLRIYLYKLLDNI